MKTFEIVTRVDVFDEETLLQHGRNQFGEDGGDPAEIATAGDALGELSHLGAVKTDALGYCLLSPLDCGVEVLRRDVREVTSGPYQEAVEGTMALYDAEIARLHAVNRKLLGQAPSPFPRSVAVEHAGELRQALADLLEWQARVWGDSGAPVWRDAKRLMTKIRDEEDEAREAR